jgi:transcriptional regulator with XRE-family HTH domain
MNNPTVLKIRAKKLGVLIRGARQSHQKSIEECAKIVGTTVEDFTSFEDGEKSPSLPQLEILAFFFSIPIEYFLENAQLHPEQRLPEKMDPKMIIKLRQRVIGALMRKTRVERGLTLDQMTERTGIPSSQLELYEFGQESIPVPELDMIAEQLGWTAKAFQDRNGPMGVWFMEQRSLRDFQELSPELKMFVSKPVNRPFLELAQRLSEMDVQKLRTVAEGLLEITL